MYYLEEELINSHLREVQQHPKVVEWTYVIKIKGLLSSAYQPGSCTGVSLSVFYGLCYIKRIFGSFPSFQNILMSFDTLAYGIPLGALIPRNSYNNECVCLSVCLRLSIYISHICAIHQKFV
jgi:hypothetical protein